MACIIRAPTSPAATTGCAPTSAAEWWRTRTSSIFRTGSPLDFRIGGRRLVRCQNGETPVIPAGTRSAARHAVPRHQFRRQPGRRTTLKERRLVSMDNMHLGALELTLTAENWSADVTVRSAIDGRVLNRGAKLYHEFNHRHLEPVADEIVGRRRHLYADAHQPIEPPRGAGRAHCGHSSTERFARSRAGPSRSRATSVRS